MAAPTRRSTPVPADSEVHEVLSTPVSPDVSQVAERSHHNKRIATMKAHFDAQPKENIKVRKDDGEQFVQVNGYTFQIQPGVVVAVPRQVANILRDADII